MIRIRNAEKSEQDISGKRRWIKMKRKKRGIGRGKEDNEDRYR
jgi:hypothetical protein